MSLLTLSLPLVQHMDRRLSQGNQTSVPDTERTTAGIEPVEVVNATAPTLPFLRWAGGKRWLVNKLPDHLGPFKFKNFHEPFLGGGALFLGLSISGRSYLSDLNAELIETYTQVRDNFAQISELLALHENTSEHYYKVRASKPNSAVERAANFIYMNHTSFNGIYRVNLKGVYNVPFGNRANKTWPTPELLASVSAKLQGVTLSVSDFATVIDSVNAGDLVFLDPPYTISHNNNGFIKYNQKLFSFDDQIRLSALIDEIREKNAFYILTNAAHESIATLFEKGDRRMELTRGNSIGGRQAKRGSATEYLFTNVPNNE